MNIMTTHTTHPTTGAGAVPPKKEDEKKEKAPTTPPVKPKIHLPLDPAVVGEEAAEEAAAADKQAVEDYVKQKAEYTATQAKEKGDKASKPPGGGGGEQPPPMSPTGEAITAALDQLYNTVHVPDHAAVETAVINAVNATPPASATSPAK
jgi:hypothetical protein